jgi:hypothetical protein
VPDQGLQMLECNGSPAQTFTYDQGKMRLMIGGLCVDAMGGKPGDVVKLAMAVPTKPGNSSRRAVLPI